MLSALCDVTERACRRLIGTLIALVVAIMVTAVCFRYGLNSPLYWTEQISRMMFVWMTFLGAAVLYRNNAHIAVRFLVELLPPVPRRACGLIGEGLCLLLFLVIVIFGTKLTLDTTKQTFGALDLSPSLYYVSAPISALLMTLYWIERVVFGRRPDGDAEIPSGGREQGADRQ